MSIVYGKDYFEILQVVLYFLPVFCFILYTLVNVTKKDRVLIRICQMLGFCFSAIFVFCKRKKLTIPGNKSIAFSKITNIAQTQLLFEAQL